MNLSLDNDISLMKCGHISGRNKSSAHDHEPHSTFMERFEYQDMFK